MSWGEEKKTEVGTTDNKATNKKQGYSVLLSSLHIWRTYKTDLSYVIIKLSILTCFVIFQKNNWNQVENILD